MTSASGTGGQEPAAASKPPGKKGASAKKMRLGKYELRKKIGAGGMGAVYLAVDTDLKRTVALKMLPREKAQNETLVKRFKSEAQSAAQMKHDNIVTIYEAGETDGYLYIALEYIEGTDVFKLVKTRGVLPIKRSIDIIKQVALALEHAHERSIVHRDIKPSNLLIQRDGAVKLADFGLARSIDDESETSITRAGMTVGTVDYMSPEQARDSKLADIRSDIYSLGCTWYHMLTGNPPFADGSMTNKLYNHAAKSRPDPREINDAVTEGIVRVMHRMMERKPADRYQTPAELLADLDNISSLTMSSAEQLLETLSDETENERDTKGSTDAAEFGAAPVGGGAPVAIPDAPDINRDWLKYGIGFGAVAGVAVLALWLTHQFSQSLDGGGVMVNRNGDGGFADVSGGDDSSYNPPKSDGTANPGGTDQTGGKRNVDSGNHSNAGGNDRPQIPVRPRIESRSVVNIEKTNDPAAIDKIEIGREGEKAYIPSWVAEFADPDHLQLPKPAAGMKTVTVGRSGDAPSMFADLNSALDALPAAGGVIRLIGKGPFDLGAVLIGDGKKIIIAGEPDGRPVVVLQPDPFNPQRPVVTLEGASLTLLNLELAAVSARFAQDDAATFFEARDSDLAVRRCSLTLLGRRSAPTAAFGTARSAKAESGVGNVRLLIDRTFVRGEGLTALAIGGTACDLVASNSLFVSGAAPFVRVGGSIPAMPKPHAGTRRPPPPERALRFLSCTGVATQSAFELTAEPDTGAIPPTGVLTLNSLFSTPRRAENLVLASLGNWPRQEQRGAGESAFINLSWKVDSSAYTGWTDFLRHDGEPKLQLTNVPQWQIAWNRIVEGSRFARGLPWPADPLERTEDVEPPLFDPATSAVDGVTATDGGAPGCQTPNLAVPEAAILQRVAASAERPIVPPPMFQNSQPVRMVKIDLDKGEDLGRVVSRNDWRSGTLFVVSGSGTRKSSQIEVRGISVRIEFHQTGTQQLEITPGAINSRTVTQQGDFADAFITVDQGGRVEIAGANIRIPNSTSVSYPKYILGARDGSFLLDDCLVQTPVVGNPRTEGVIYWERAENTPVTSGGAGRYEQYGEIHNSFIKGAGKLMRLDLAGRAMVVRNSVLVATNDLMDINIRGEGDAIHGALDVRQSTLTARNRFFVIGGSSRKGTSAQPLRLLVENSVLTASTAAGDGPTLLSYNVAPVREERQVEWWGEANGYTHLLQHHLEGPAEASGRSKDFEPGWRDAWHTAACLRPLYGSGAIALKNPLPPPARQMPSDYELHPSSKAVTWTADGKTIGAIVATLEKVGPDSTVETRDSPAGGNKGPRKSGF